MNTLVHEGIKDYHCIIHSVVYLTSIVIHIHNSMDFLEDSLRLLYFPISQHLLRVLLNCYNLNPAKIIKNSIFT